MNLSCPDGRPISRAGSKNSARELVAALPSSLEFSQVAHGPHIAKNRPELLTSVATSDSVIEQALTTLKYVKDATTAGAAFNAILAIRGSDEVASHERLPIEENDLADMFRKLESVIPSYRDDAGECAARPLGVSQNKA